MIQWNQIVCIHFIANCRTELGLAADREMRRDLILDILDHLRTSRNHCTGILGLVVCRSHLKRNVVSASNKCSSKEDHIKKLLWRIGAARAASAPRQASGQLHYFYLRHQLILVYSGSYNLKSLPLLVNSWEYPCEKGNAKRNASKHFTNSHSSPIGSWQAIRVL